MDILKIEFFQILGEQIKNTREEKKLTIDDVSTKTGIRKSYLQKIEKGTAYGLLTTQLFLIAEVLETEACKLVDF